MTVFTYIIALIAIIIGYYFSFKPVKGTYTDMGYVSKSIRNIE